MVRVTVAIGIAIWAIMLFLASCASVKVRTPDRESMMVMMHEAGRTLAYYGLKPQGPGARTDARLALDAALLMLKADRIAGLQDAIPDYIYKHAPIDAAAGEYVPAIQSAIAIVASMTDIDLAKEGRIEEVRAYIKAFLEGADEGMKLLEEGGETAS